MVNIMCGICGTFNFKGTEAENKRLLDIMCDSLKHRGPDSQGTVYFPSAALGHTRLSIIDLVTGDQPLRNHDGSVWVTFNGEIFNFQQLRVELEMKGHNFNTRSDTETIVHLYEETGTAFVQHLRGMFAIALWDNTRKRLILARDRMGEKPLYYSQTNQGLIFASELKALLLSGILPRKTLDPCAVNEYLTYGYVSAPRSILTGVNKLKPAHLLIADKQGITVERYWTLDVGKTASATSLDDTAEHVHSLIQEATRLRMLSDVPIGYFLSGGIDSSSIVATAAELSHDSLKTFSIGFDEDSFSELKYAKIVAERFGTEHRELTVTASMSQGLEGIVYDSDEPLSDPSMVPMYYLSKLTRDNTKVVIGGDGGDEAFGGYDRYLGLKLTNIFNRIPWPVRRYVISPVASLIPESSRKADPLRRIKRLLHPALHTSEDRYMSWLYQFNPLDRWNVYTGQFKEILSDNIYEDPIKQKLTSEKNIDQISWAQMIDTFVYLPGDLMVKADRMTMAHGLELRSPFLDHILVEYAATIPTNMKIHGLSQKTVLKRAFKGVLPSEILSRPKAGFSIPYSDWLRTDLKDMVYDLLLRPNSHVGDLVKPTAVENMIYEHMNLEANHGTRIWNLLCLELWCQRFGVRIS